MKAPAQFTLVWLWVVLPLFAQPTPPPAALAEHRFIFILDTSLSMRRVMPALRGTAFDLIANGVEGRMHSGDIFELWTFNDESHTRVYPAKTWLPEMNETLALRAFDIVSRQRFENRGRPDKALADMNQAVAKLSALTIVLLTDGEDGIHGTPYDAMVNARFRERFQALRRAHEIFVVLFEARGGKLAGWAVNSSSEPIQFPLSDVVPQLVRRPTSAPEKTAIAEVPVEPAVRAPAPAIVNPPETPVPTATSAATTPPTPPPAAPTSTATVTATGTAAADKPVTSSQPPAAAPSPTPVVESPPPTTQPAAREPTPAPPPTPPADATTKSAPEPPANPPPQTPPPPQRVERVPVPAPTASETAIASPRPDQRLPSVTSGAVPLANPQALGAPLTPSLAPETRSAAAKEQPRPQVPPTPSPTAATAPPPTPSTAIVLPLQPGSGRWLYLVLGLGLLLVGVALVFWLARHQRPVHQSSLISQSFERKQK